MKRALAICILLIVVTAASISLAQQRVNPSAGQPAPSTQPPIIPPVPPAATRPAGWPFDVITQPQRTPGDVRRDCVICHLDWSDAFTRPGARPLIERPAGPLVAESETCLGCHDGSVGDARRRVWQEHGHSTNIVPPEGMQVPAVLPLKDGKIACRTCHNAHGGLGPETLATIVFLRVPNESSQLCQLCHPGMAKGPSAGTHPLGGMPWPIPVDLLTAGGKAGPNEFSLICQSCHTSHGAAAEHLLVMGTESSQLCLTCHAKMRPGMFRPDVPREHPQSPPLETPAQHKAIQDMGTQVGQGDRLICLSCHKVHNGLAGRYMLADTLVDSNLCLRCHPERDVMFDTPHDLRKTAPEAVNRLGQTPAQSGPCGACHSFHTFARRPSPEPGDPTGLCATCHQEGEPAGHKTGLPISHTTDVTLQQVPLGIDLLLYPPPGETTPRTLACLTCHDPHLVRKGNFLRKEKDPLCATCHVEQARHLPETHDFTGKPDLRNARDQNAEQAGRCGFCHGVHNALGPAMWIATKDAPANRDALCTLCHRAGASGATKPVSLFNHPTGQAAPGPKATIPPDLPLFDAQGRKSPYGFVACGSCHDPHVDKRTSERMLRGGHDPVSLCVACHRAQVTMAEGPHDRGVKPEAWPKDIGQGQLCFACHLVHGNDELRKLWTVAPAAGAPNRHDGVCIACHAAQSWSPPTGQVAVGQMQHPRTLQGVPDVHDLPVQAEGENGAMMCSTCHEPHVQRTDHMLRPVGASSAGVCYVCHPDSRSLDRSLHAPWVDPALKSEAQVCGPCHAVHAVEGSKPANLWAAGLNPAGRDLSQQECLSCHREGGSGKVVNVVQHPDVLVPGVPRIESITAMRVELMPHDRITCITCHLPHGQIQSGPAVPATQESLPLLRASKPMVRMNVSGQVCSMCHGFDAARKFLYYHRPGLRQAPLPDSSEPVQ